MKKRIISSVDNSSYFFSNSDTFEIQNSGEGESQALMMVLAQTAPAGSYTITYNSNGGSGSMTAGSATSDKAFTLPDCTFTAPTDKTFKEWAIGSQNSLTRVAAGGTYTFTADTTVYAVWEGSVWNGLSAQYFAGGTGTEADPYQIATAEQLCLFSAVINQMNYSTTVPTSFGNGNRKVTKAQDAQTYENLRKAYYKLTADIVLNDTNGWESWNTTAPANSWYPIGRSGSLFSGNFDGDGKTISGMYYNDTTDSEWNGQSGGNHVGLFGYSAGNIQKVTVKESYLKGYKNVGGVAAANTGTMEECTNIATVTAQSYVGGVAAANTGAIKDCTNNGNVSAVENYAGGVLASNGSKGTVENCKNSGAVYGNNHVGGIVGYNDNASIINCQNSGNVSGENNIGGIAAYNYYHGSISGCHNLGLVSGETNTGGVAGENITAVVKNCSSPKALTKDATGEIGEYGNPKRNHDYLGYIIGHGNDDEGDAGENTGNSSDGNVGVTVSPASWICPTSGGEKQLTATVTGETTQTVTWSIANDDANIEIDQTGKVTVASTVTASSSYVIKAVSTADTSKYGIAVVTINTPTLTVPSITVSGTLPDGKVDTAYSKTLTATGYPAPAWSISSGSLPAGLSMNATTGEISGTPTKAGTYSFTVKATNNQGNATKALSIKITSTVSASLSDNAASLDFGTVFTGYAAPAAKTVILTNNGTQSITIAQPSNNNYTIGTVSNLTIAPGGVGTFTVAPVAGLAAGSYNTALQVKVGSSVYAEIAVKFTVQDRIPAAPAITTTSLPGGMVGTAYTQTTLTATGYPVPTWTVSDGSLPAGLSLSADGKITGTPTASGTYSFTVKATNTKGSSTKELSISVASPITSMSIDPAAATVKKTKTRQFTAAVKGVDNQAVTWSVTGGTKSSIDQNGLLTVGATETATTLTVKATSKADSSKYVTAKVTVAAAPRIFKVTFDSNGGSAVPAIENIEEGYTIALPNAPTKANCRFDGWFTAKDGGNAFTSSTAVNSNLTVYARWTKLVTVSGTVVEEDGAVISGASVTLTPDYNTTAVTTGSDGKFSFENIPEDLFTATAAFSDGSSATVNVTGDYSNVKIVRPKPVITITQQPADLYIVKGIAGQSATFSVTAKRTPFIADSIGIKWYWLKDTTPSAGQAGTTDVQIDSGNGSSVTINQDNGNIPERGTYKLYAHAYDASNSPFPETYSRIATLKVVGTSTIEGVVTKEGSAVANATVELIYTGGTWPYGTVAMTSSQSAQTTAADGKYSFLLVPDGQYKLKITLPNNGGEITYGPYNFPGSNPDPDPIDPGIVIPDAAEIRINSQPQDATVKNGTTVTLTAEAAATDGTVLSYQWYRNAKNAITGGTAISGATAKTYTPSTAEKGTNYYYCVVSGGSLLPVTTRAAKVTVYTYGVIAGTVQTDAKQPIKGATVELVSLDAKKPADFDSILPAGQKITTGADGKYRFTEVPDGQYALKITLPGGESFEQPIDVPVVNPDIPVIPPQKPTLSIISQPKNRTVVLNDTAEFTAQASASNGSVVLYQWYRNSTNSTTGGTAIPGATGSTYQASTGTKGVGYYYCVMRSTGMEAVTSNVAKLTVRNTPLDNLMTIEGDVVDSGAKIKDATVTLSPAAGTSLNPQTTGEDGHYKFENLPDGKYTVTVQLPGGGTVNKEIIINDGETDPVVPGNIDVPTKNTITITRQPKSTELTTEMDAGFTTLATASKAGVSYQWYKSSKDASSGGTLLDGKTQATLDLGKQPVGTSYYYCVVSSEGAEALATDAVKLTVTKAPDSNGELKGNIVSDKNGDPVEGVSIKLMKNGTEGIQFGATLTTDENGKFQFSNIPYGSYSLVAEKDTQIVTRQISVKSASVSESLVLPSGTKITKVVVSGEGTPSAAVENLEAMFTKKDNDLAQQIGAEVEIKLVVERQDDPADKDSITELLGTDQQVGLYLNAKLVKTINGTMENDSTEEIQPTAGQTLRIVLDLPAALQGKTGYKVLRSHTENGIISTQFITPDYDSVLKTLAFDADAFSTYAVIYTKDANSGGGSSGGNGGGGTGGITDNPVANDPVISKPIVNNPVKNDPNGGNGGTDGTETDDTDLEKTREDALKQLEEKRDEAIKALPNTLTDAERQAALDEINRIYAEAVLALQEADSAKAINDVTNKAFQSFSASVTNAGGEMEPNDVTSNEKPLILLSALLAVVALIGAVLVWLGKEKGTLTARIIAVIAAIAAIALFFITTGWHGMALANWWTIAIAVLAAISVVLSLWGKTKDVNN